MGRPWRAHQRHTADLIGERYPDGRYVWPVVVILFPRQAGKTTLVFDLVLGRCLRYPDYRCAYTAQTGMMAAARFADRAAALARSPLDPVVRVHRGAGRERMSLGAGSFVRAFPPRDGALRGETLDLVVVDEAQEIDAAAGELLDQSIIPTTTNRPRRQLILIGTAGTADSRFLRRYLDQARAAAASADPEAGRIAVVEYGFPEVDPDTGVAAADPLAEATWKAWHPGLVTGLTDLDALRTGLTALGPDGFSREYGNVWQASAERVIPPALWAAARRPSTSSAGAAVTYGVDVALDRSAAAVLACWTDSDGVEVVEVVELGAGVTWCAPRLAALHAEHGGAVWLDAGGPAGTIVTDLAGSSDRPPAWLHPVGGRELAAACAGFLDRLGAGRVAHLGDRRLDAAVDAAARRPLGDGWVWGRRIAGGDLAPLVAASLALYGAGRRAAPVKPTAYAE